MAVFGYVRVSTERQADEGVSLDEQKRRIEGRAVEEGWQFAEVYVERGVSGATPFVERLKGRQLDARLRKGDILVAAKLDRMFRSALDALNVIEDLMSRAP